MDVARGSLKPMKMPSWGLVVDTEGGGRGAMFEMK